jgi:hypothetical protein
MAHAFFHLVIAAAALLTTTPIIGQTPLRVRGTISAINEGSLTVKERNGRTFVLKTGRYTAYAYVVPSSLEAIKVNDFVGSAVKGQLGSFVAVELAIIPENMRAGRISLYGWDPLPDPTAGRTSEMTATSMTNGLVSNVSLSTRGLANGTNGVVSAEKVSAAGLIVTITYDGGGKWFRIAVPPNAPIVRYVLAKRSAVTIGSAVMIKTNPGGHAGLVTVGKGVTPPM